MSIEPIVRYTLTKSVSTQANQELSKDLGASPPSSEAMEERPQMPWTMYNREGQRKYLTKSEREAFLVAARNKSEAVRSFCWVIAATGCRISEALALTGRNIDFEAEQVVIECLKKRGKQVFRAIPLPAELLRNLKTLIETVQLSNDRLWPWSRMTGYRRIREVMEEAGVIGAQATPKGLRHGFGVCAIQSKVPLNMVQRWLGHADIKTTSIYTSAMGPEERQIASLMWSDSLADVPAEQKKSKTDQSKRVRRQATRCKTCCECCHSPQSTRFALVPPGGGDLVSSLETIKKSLIDSSQIVGPPQAHCHLIHFWLFRPRIERPSRTIPGGEDGGSSRAGASRGTR